MKKNSKHIKNLKRGVALFTALFFFCFSATAQKATTTENTRTLSEKTKLIIRQSPDNQKARALFKEVYNITLTDEEFINKMSTSKENLQLWEGVVVHFKNDRNVDISFIRNAVAGMKQKLQTTTKF